MKMVFANWVLSLLTSHYFDQHSTSTDPLEILDYARKRCEEKVKLIKGLSKCEDFGDVKGVTKKIADRVLQWTEAEEIVRDRIGISCSNFTPALAQNQPDARAQSDSGISPGGEAGTSEPQSTSAHGNPSESRPPSEAGLVQREVDELESDRVPLPATTWVATWLGGSDFSIWKNDGRGVEMGTDFLFATRKEAIAFALAQFDKPSDNEPKRE